MTNAMRAVQNARESLEKSRETDRDKESIAHLEDAVSFLAASIDPAGATAKERQKPSADESDEGDNSGDDEEGGEEEDE